MQNLYCRNVRNVKFPKIVAEKFAFYRNGYQWSEIDTANLVVMFVFLTLSRTVIVAFPVFSAFTVFFTPSQLKLSLSKLTEKDSGSGDEPIGVTET